MSKGMKIFDIIFKISLSVMVIGLIFTLIAVVAIYGFYVGGQCYSHQIVQRVSAEHTLTVNYVHFATQSASDITVHSQDNGAAVTQVGDVISYCVPWGGGVAYNFHNDSLPKAHIQYRAPYPGYQHS